MSALRLKDFSPDAFTTVSAMAGDVRARSQDVAKRLQSTADDLIDAYKPAKRQVVALQADVRDQLGGLRSDVYDFAVERPVAAVAALVGLGLVVGLLMSWRPKRRKPKALLTHTPLQPEAPPLSPSRTNGAVATPTPQP
jgi:ElaB/YqjD/DUF883 family membrane-anchored ribosome-binding protein